MRRRRTERADQYESPIYKALQARLSRNAVTLRAKRQWSQEEAAHRSGMATRVYQRVEGRDVNLTLTTLARLCDGFGVDVVELLKGRAPPKRG